MYLYFYSFFFVKNNIAEHLPPTNQTVKDAAHVMSTSAESISASKVAGGGLAKKKKGVAAAGTAKLESHPSANIASFTVGASPAQIAQIEMIKKVFELMDVNKDGFLSMTDLRTYFRSIGRNLNDAQIRAWIQDRDVDQDGSVSLAEYVASFANQLDLSSQYNTLGSTTAAISPVTLAFGVIKLGNTNTEVLEACRAANEYVTRVLDNPSVHAFWRIFVSDSEFQRSIGHLFGGVRLMTALGFEVEENGRTLALRDPNGTVWDTIPVDVRSKLSKRLDELKTHWAAICEPTISNVAAGELFQYFSSTCCIFFVS